MRTPIFVRSLSEEEREELEAGLRSKNAFTNAPLTGPLSKRQG